MVHAARACTRSPTCSPPGTLAVEPGVAYTKFSRSTMTHEDEDRPYGYSIAPFLGDPTLAQQVFVTAEPIAARRQGADPQVFLIAESGFNPYAAV